MTNRVMVRYLAVVLGCWCGALTPSCGSKSDATDGTVSSGGRAGGANASAAAGSAVGGTSATGKSTPGNPSGGETTGTPAGSTAIGGNAPTGGATSNGAAGGSTTGNPNSGGTVNTLGSTAIGGNAPTGGATSNGAAGGSTTGNPNSGGTVNTLGSTAFGGNLAAAGATNSSPSNGGTNAAAGASTSTRAGSAGFSAQGPISRVTMPQSVFTPTELEDTINDLVAEINKVPFVNLRLDVISKADSTYFQPMIVGSSRARGELHASGSTASPAAASTNAEMALAQISMLTDDIAQGSKGIGLIPWTDDLLTPINDTVARGIPLVTIDADLASSNRDLYIGTLSSQAGTTGGNTLKSFLPSGGGTVIILGHGDPSWPDGYNRTMGAKAVFDAAGYTTKVITVSWVDSGVTDLAALHDALTAADPPAVGMLGVFSNSWECAKAAESMSLTGSDIAIVAFDLDPHTVAYMRSGLVQATHALRQFYKGYLTPYVLYGMNVLGKEKTTSILGAQMVDAYQLDTGLDVIGATQLDEYSAYLSKLGVSAGY